MDQRGQALRHLRGLQKGPDPSGVEKDLDLGRVIREDPFPRSIGWSAQPVFHESVGEARSIGFGIGSGNPGAWWRWNGGDAQVVAGGTGWRESSGTGGAWWLSRVTQPEGLLGAATAGQPSEIVSNKLR